jgi:hypothetical protein
VIEINGVFMTAARWLPDSFGVPPLKGITIGSARKAKNTMTSAADTAAEGQTSAPFRKQPLSDNIDRYLLTLARQRPFAVQIKTESLGIVLALEERWPLDPKWENEALELWQLIAGLAYPLVSSVKAHYALLTIIVGEALKPPPPPEGPALCAVFDAIEGVLRYRLIAPHEAHVVETEAPATTGMLLTCRPAGENFYRQHEIVSEWVHQHNNLFSQAWTEWIQSALNLLYEMEAEKTAQGEVMDQRTTAEIHNLEESFRRFFLHFYTTENAAAIAATVASPASAAPPTSSPAAAMPPASSPVAGAVSSAAGQRPASATPVQMPLEIVALEERLLIMGADHRFSARFRAAARQLVQQLRNLYPSTLINDAAFATLARVQEMPVETPSQPEPTPVTTPATETSAPLPAAEAHIAPHLQAPEPEN